MQEDQKIRFTNLTGKLGATLIMPLETAKRNGLNRPTNVLVEKTENEILMKKKDKNTYGNKDRKLQI